MRRSRMIARLHKHFGFSRTETNGTFALLLLTSICLLVPQGLKWYYSLQPEADHAQDIALLERTLMLLEAHKKSPKCTPKKFKKELHSLQSMPSFDINIADEIQLSTIEGIGPVLSARIVKFRNQLGGFISKAQCQEIYGLRPEVAERLKQHTYIGVDFQPEKIDINTADAQTLAAHPYITYQQARSIARYRAQHGPFLTTESLSALELIDKATLEKLNPYLHTTQKNQPNCPEFVR
jgi:DNA uptake protein ComE-like DNA-binding protein